jgi:hypothetical protein
MRSHQLPIFARRECGGEAREARPPVAVAKPIDCQSVHHDHKHGRERTSGIYPGGAPAVALDEEIPGTLGIARLERSDPGILQWPSVDFTDIRPGIGGVNYSINS